MMILPEEYISNISDKSLDNLIVERNLIIRELHRLEKSGFLDTGINPSPEIMYEFNNLYLLEITKLINDTFRENNNNWL